MNGYHSKHLVNVICKLLILTIYLGLDLLGVSDGQLIIVLFTNGLQELFHDLQQEHQNSKFISRLNLIDIFDWAFGYAHTFLPPKALFFLFWVLEKPIIILPCVSTN